MSLHGTLLRRHFEPLVLSVQVVVDLAVLLASCWLGYLLGAGFGHIRFPPGAPLPPERLYQDLALLISALCLVSFHAFGMYSPSKSRLNRDEFKAIAQSTLVSAMVLLTLLVCLRGSPQAWIRPRGFDVDSLSRATLLFTFGLILVLTSASRFASFKLIQRLHRRHIGNRNVLILGAGDIGRRLGRRFELAPTLGLDLVGFVDDDPTLAGQAVDRCRVLGSSADLERLVAQHEVGEVFVALPELAEERLLELLARLDRLGLRTHVVPHLPALPSSELRIESLDSIPLVSRARPRAASGAWR